LKKESRPYIEIFQLKALEAGTAVASAHVMHGRSKAEGFLKNRRGVIGVTLPLLPPTTLCVYFTAQAEADEEPRG
jgi:hypothetical protein